MTPVEERIDHEAERSMINQAYRYAEQVRGGVVLSTFNLAFFIERLAKAHDDLLTEHTAREEVIHVLLSDEFLVTVAGAYIGALGGSDRRIAVARRRALEKFGADLTSLPKETPCQ